MKRYTGQLDHIEDNYNVRRIWLKNVLPSQLGYCKRYIELPTSAIGVIDARPNTWVEFNGIDTSELQIKHSSFIKEINT